MRRSASRVHPAVLSTVHSGVRPRSLFASPSEVHLEPIHPGVHPGAIIKINWVLAIKEKLIESNSSLQNGTCDIDATPTISLGREVRGYGPIAIAINARNNK